MEGFAAQARESLAPGEPLLQLRCGPWRALLRLREVERVLEAALPSAAPTAAPGALPTVALEGEPLPVLFGEALLGAERVTLRAGDKLVALRHGARRALLWVSAVEDVVPAGPIGPAVGDWTLGTCGEVAVLDLPRLLDDLEAER